jgi:hypothetical protein
MPDSFVPLLAASGPSPAGGAFQLKVLPQAESRPVFTPLSGSGAAGAAACARPVLTLQRQGEAVSAIRVECSCGQVIDLKCVY